MPRCADDMVCCTVCAAGCGCVDVCLFVVCRLSSERDWLRVVVLSHLSEPSEPLSTQLCLCVAAMAKYDAGRQWPSLLPTLLSGLSSGDRVSCLRYTFAFHCVVKQMQTVKTPQGRHTFAAVAASTASHIANHSRQHTERLCELVSAQRESHAGDDCRCPSLCNIVSCR